MLDIRRNHVTRPQRKKPAGRRMARGRGTAAGSRPELPTTGQDAARGVVSVGAVVVIFGAVVVIFLKTFTGVSIAVIHVWGLQHVSLKLAT